MKGHHFHSFFMASLFFCFSFSSVFAQYADSIVIKLNTTDCRLCYLRLERIKEIQNKKITVVCHLNSYRACEKIMHDHFGKDTIIIFPSDSLYYTLHSVFGSEIFLFKEGDLLYKTPLKEFSGFKPQSVTFDTVAQVPVDEIISEFAKVNQYKGKYFINDPYYKKFYSFDTLKRKWIIHDFSKDNFIPSLLSGHLIDSSDLKLRDGVLAAIENKDIIEGIKLSAPYQIDSLLYYLISFYVPRRITELENRLTLEIVSSVISYNLLKDTITGFIPLIAGQDFDDKMYFKYQCVFISENGRDIILAGYKSHKSDTVVYRIINKDLNSQPVMIFGKLPDFYTKSGLFYNFSIPVAKKKILFFPHSSEIFFLPGFSSVGKLPFSNDIPKNSSSMDVMNNLRFAVIDFDDFDNVLYAIHYNRKQKALIQSIYDLNSRQVLNVSPIRVPEGIGIYSLSYTKPDYFCGMTTDAKYLIRVRIVTPR